MFDDTMVRTDVFFYTNDGSPAIQCTAPPGNAGTVALTWSLNGNTFSE
jgi:hypothetical protein